MMLGCRPCLERPAAGEREREQERQLARDDQDQLTGRADTSLGSCGRLGSLQAAGISANRWAGTSSTESGSSCQSDPLAPDTGPGDTHQ